MPFEYVLLGLVTLAFLHVSSGEHSLLNVFGRAHHSSSTSEPLGGGGESPLIAVEAKCYGNDFFDGAIGR